MATVEVKTLGSNEVKRYSVGTVGDLKAELDLEKYSAIVNGDSQNDDFELSDDDLVTLAPSVKGN